MRALLRCLLIALLVACLVEAPVVAAPSVGLGVVMQAQRAHVSGGEAVDGATIFDGDLLATDSAGNLRVRLGGGQLYLPEESAAAIRQAGGGVSAVLQHGTVIFSTSGLDPFELRASEARIRPLTAQPTFAQVTLLGPLEFLVTIQRGQLEVTIGDELHTLSEVASYRVWIDPDSQGPQGAGTKGQGTGGKGETKSGKEQGKKHPTITAGRSYVLPIALTLIAVGTVIGVWLLVRSPSDP